MTRALAGLFDPRSGAAPDLPSLLARSGGPLAAGPGAPAGWMTRELGRPLRVAFSGGRAHARPLCLLSGHLDNRAELARALDLAPDRPAEQVLAIAYNRWTLEMLPRLRGEFALLIWDEERRTGVIARDQLGIRDVFLHESSGALRFATEVAHLLALLPVRPAPDATALAQWIAGIDPVGGRTLYRGVRKLAPGTAVVLDTSGLREVRYWSPRYSGPAPGTASAAERDAQAAAAEQREREERVREAIACAVRRRMDPGGVTAVLMSGGLDSASVAAFAARERPGLVTACSGTFPGHPEADESESIARLRTALGLPAITVRARAGGLLQSGLDSLAAWQLPPLSWGDFWTAPLLRAASARGARVVLGGDGGDELFATRVFLLADDLRRGRPRAALRLARELPGAGDRPPPAALLSLASQLAISGALPPLIHARLTRALGCTKPPSWLTSAAAREVRDSVDPHRWKRLDGPRWWAHALDGLTDGLDAVGIFALHRQRAALAGIEARHPLLDLDLVELVLGEPPRASFDRHRNRPVLRACMRGLLPEEVLSNRAKARFDSLVADSLDVADGEGVRRLLCDRRAELGAYVDLGKMRSALFAQPDGRSDSRRRHPGRDRARFERMQQLWRLTSAECWLRAQGDPALERLRPIVRPSPARATVSFTPALIPFSALTGARATLGLAQDSGPASGTLARRISAAAAAPSTQRGATDHGRPARV